MQNKIITWLLDLIYPPRCMLCRRLVSSSRTTVCINCLDTLPDYDGAPLEVRFAKSCAATFYYEEKLREAFLRYKFYGRKSYGAQFGKWLAVTIRDKYPDFDVMTWVPVSKKRRRERGYDQAEIVCRAAAKELGVLAVPILTKIRHNEVQSRLHDISMRHANASGAYSVLRDAEISGKRILLIDDIVTTGSTLSECCRVLLTAGAESVVCAALATPRKQEDR